jgi:putative hydrolase of the HAD superfamily
MPHYAPGQTLLIDADDTLWENNIYFERAIAAFIGFLNHREYTPAEVREALNRVERENILQHGYGLASFTRSLVDCYMRLSAAEPTEAQKEKVRGFARTIGEQEIELLAGVRETLEALGGRHRLILMTKGNQAEQADKLERSGLAGLFAAVEIVAEKDAATYLAVLAKYAPAEGTAWMIGNSPRSDINPALAAGLNAVHLFHKDTWVLEHAELIPPPEGQRLLELEGFTRLTEFF